MAAVTSSVAGRKTFFRTDPDHLEGKEQFCVVQAIPRIQTVISMHTPQGEVAVMKTGELTVISPEALKGRILDPNEFEQCDGPVRVFPNRGAYEAHLLAIGRLNPSEAKECKSK